MFECCICHQHARTTLVGLLSHIRAVHPHFANRVVCGLNGCPATPSSFEALRRHMYRYHQDLLNISSTLTSSHGSNADHDDDEHQFQTPDDSSSATSDVEQSVCQSPQIIGAEFILKIRDGRKLTQVATDEIINDTKIVLQNTTEVIEKKVIDKIKNLGVVSDDQLAEIRGIFNDVSLVNPFKGLETEYQQQKFISENFNYVVSLFLWVITQ